MSKLVKDLKDDDLVYAVYKNYDTVIECKIKIKFDPDWKSPCGYFTKHMQGVIKTSNEYLTKDHYGDFQVFRIGSAGIYDEDLAKENNITQKNIYQYYPTIPGSIPIDEYENQLVSNKFMIYDNFYVFTNVEDAKNFIVDKKLESIRNDLKKNIKIRKYKEND